MQKLERELQAQQLNLLNAQIGVLCQMYADAHYMGVPHDLNALLEKNREVGRMIADLTKEIYE